MAGLVRSGALSTAQIAASPPAPAGRFIRRLEEKSRETLGRAAKATRKPGGPNPAIRAADPHNPDTQNPDAQDTDAQNPDARDTDAQDTTPA